MRYRISIASMMAIILITALCLVALRINSVFWGGMLLLTTLAVLCAATFISLCGSGPSRPAWIGCAVFGWTCFFLGIAPLANERLGPLRMTEMFEEAIPHINPELDAQIRKYASAGSKGYSEGFPRNLATISSGFHRYRQSSQSILTLGFAALGAFLGRAQAVRNSPAEPKD